MYLDPFFTTENGQTVIRPEQASQFAKEVSDDFNPLHNPEHKRFCVPGDLLFALSLAKYGLSQKMQFNYTGMVGKDSVIVFPEHFKDAFELVDLKGKACLNATNSGDVTNDMALIEAFTRAYVAFSGHSFPHILVPLMREKGVMINPDRPMVIYESMSFEFSTMSLSDISLKLSGTRLDVTGKRGKVTICFDLLDGENKVGEGQKTMIMSGLRAFEEEKVQDLINLYEAAKTSYKSA